MSSPLREEFLYYLAHQAELVQKYAGKFITVKNCTVLGAFDDEITAIRETEKEHQLGTFLVQEVAPGDSAYSQTFHSRAVFA